MKNKSEEAVSPVIGVILMVAITVILAAVVAAFVFGMANNIQETRVVMVSIHQVNGSTISLTNMGGTGVRGLSSIDITGDLRTLPAAQLPFAVGSIRNYELSVGTGPKQVIVTGTWLDGTQQVLLTSTVQRTV